MILIRAESPVFGRNLGRGNEGMAYSRASSEVGFSTQSATNRR